jgi:uncharacterized protein DUF6768
MSEHDDSLRRALEENARLRSEREESLREVASSEYSGRVRFAERVYWAYAIPCVALGVASINFFSRSYDLKTLIGSAVVMLVLYETTVLMKLWFATARMKMDVLKEMKLLRLEVARLGTAVGVEQPSQPPVKYEPMRGVSPWERKFWLVACVLAAMGVSSWTANAWKLGGGDRSTDTVVTLAADGTAEERTETSKPYSSYYKPSGLTHYAPKDQNHRFLDQMGQELPAEVVVTGAQARRDVTYTKSVFVDGMMRYTRISDIPGAAELKEGVWVYQDGMRTGGSEQEYVRTVLLPPGAKFLSAEPTADVEVDEDGRTQVRFKGMTVDDVQHMFTIRYKLPSEDEKEE